MFNPMGLGALPMLALAGKSLGKSLLSNVIGSVFGGLFAPKSPDGSDWVTLQGAEAEVDVFGPYGRRVPDSDYIRVQSMDGAAGNWWVGDSGGPPSAYHATQRPWEPRANIVPKGVWPDPVTRRPAEFIPAGNSSLVSALRGFVPSSKELRVLVKGLRTNPSNRLVGNLYQRSPSGYTTSKHAIVAYLRSLPPQFNTSMLTVTGALTPIQLDWPSLNAAIAAVGWPQLGSASRPSDLYGLAGAIVGAGLAEPSAFPLFVDAAARNSIPAPPSGVLTLSQYIRKLSGQPEPVQQQPQRQEPVFLPSGGSIPQAEVSPRVLEPGAPQPDTVTEVKNVVQTMVARESGGEIPIGIPSINYGSGSVDPSMPSLKPGVAERGTEPSSAVAVAVQKMVGDERLGPDEVAPGGKPPAPPVEQPKSGSSMWMLLAAVVVVGVAVSGDKRKSK